MNHQRHHQGHFARKRFGQNFLTDPLVIDNIINAINPQNGQAIIEIGPGLGALTLPMTEKLDKLAVIELDRDLVARLQANPSLRNKLIIYQADALTVDFNPIFVELGQHPLRIVGNLPYNISTPLMFHLFNYLPIIADMYFMLQKEVVKRLLATPNTKDYGRLSVMAQYYCQLTPVMDVPPSAFIPAPKVNSAVIKLAPHHLPLHQVENIHLLNKVVTTAFSQRRKTIKNSLQQLLDEADLINLDLDITLRAENLTLEQYCKITHWLQNKNTPTIET